MIEALAKKAKEAILKPRTVILTLEVRTDAPLALLRKASAYNDSCLDIEVIQAQANVQQGKEEVAP